MAERRYWFKRRRFGIGWTPNTREAWVSVAAFTLLEAASGAVLGKTLTDGKRIARQVQFGLAIAFAIFVAANGEPLF